MTQLKRSVIRAVGLGSAALLIAVPAAAGAGHGKLRLAYAVSPAPYRALAQFAITYVGSGKWATRYHSEPPNQGGNHDTNDANDASTQAWSLTFTRPLTIPKCGPPKRGAKDPCLRIGSISPARGSNLATGRVSHVHVDGLFPAQNASVRCRVSASTPRKLLLHDAIRVRYDAHAKVLAFTALSPVIDALNYLPGSCPSQGDPIDGLGDNYFTPGLSFSGNYGPERWFTSAAISIPLTVLHRARVIAVRLKDTRAGSPPKNCGVRHPAYERCTTGGSWSGVLTLTRR